MTALALVLIVLAAARVTRVITTDKVGEPLRTWWYRHTAEGGMLEYLIGCRWCAGLWVSVPAAAAAWWATPLHRELPLTGWLAVPALVLACSYLVGLLITLEPED